MNLHFSQEYLRVSECNEAHRKLNLVLRFFILSSYILHHPRILDRRRIVISLNKGVKMNMQTFVYNYHHISLPVQT